MAWVVTAIVGSAIVGGTIDYVSAERAEDKQYAAGERAVQDQRAALEFNRRQLGRTDKAYAREQRRLAAEQLATGGRFATALSDREAQYADQISGIDPIIQAGQTATSGLASLDADNPWNRQQFMDDEGYQFRMAEGQKALERGAASRGMLLSGRQFKELERFAQGTASDEYAAAFDRYSKNRESRRLTLSDLADRGLQGAQLKIGAGIDYTGAERDRSSAISTISGQRQQAIQDLAILRAGYAGANASGLNNIGNVRIGQGNAAAAATVAQGGIINDTISSLAQTGVKAGQGGFNKTAR